MTNRPFTGGDAFAFKSAPLFNVLPGDTSTAVPAGLLLSTAIALTGAPLAEGEEQRRIADDPRVHGARVEGFRQRRGGRELGPLNVVREILQGVGRLQLRTHAAF